MLSVVTTDECMMFCQMVTYLSVSMGKKYYLLTNNCSGCKFAVR